MTGSRISVFHSFTAEKCSKAEEVHTPHHTVCFSTTTQPRNYTPVPVPGFMRGLKHISDWGTENWVFREKRILTNSLNHSPFLLSLWFPLTFFHNSSTYEIKLRQSDNLKDRESVLICLRRGTSGRSNFLHGSILRFVYCFFP